MTDDIEWTRARLRWWGYSQWLRRYSEKCSLTALPCFKYRVEWFVLIRTGVLLGLVWLALQCPVVAGLIALYFIADALAVNTSYVFVTGSPISVLRSVLLTFATYLSVAFGFAVGWVRLGEYHQGAAWERVVAAVYESVRTLTTAGPEKPPDSSVGRLLVTP